MFKKNVKNNQYLYLLFILLTIFIIILILFSYKNYEYYDSPSQPISGTFTLNSFNQHISDEEGGNHFFYQKGIGSKTHKGTIKFTQPFLQNPYVFTQVNGTPDAEDNLYSITVSNITPNSFDYYKNVVSNNIIPPEEGEGEPMVAMKLSNDDSTPFNWFAFQ